MTPPRKAAAVVRVTAPPSPRRFSTDRRKRIAELRAKAGRNVADNAALLDLVVDELLGPT